MLRSATWCVLVPALACAEPQAPDVRPAPTAAASPSEPAAPAPASSPATAAGPSAGEIAAPAPASSAATTGGSTPCGELGCLAFDSAEAAFASIVAQKPLVLALGEAHAQKGTEDIDSATKRFAETLLPSLKGQASDLVVELLVPPKGCEQAKKEVVENVEKPVTSNQRASNKNEFVVLGEKSKALGVQPWALDPSCKQFEAVAKGGADGVAAMLTLIADLTAERVAKQMEKSPGKMVIAYGGALHNDVVPDPERAAWSFGPRLVELTKGRYVELDLIVPEYVKDSDTWKRLAWYPHYDREKLGAKAVLYRVAPGSYTLVFPLTR